MKNKHDGWSERRRYKRERDRIARQSFGCADDRAMRHALDVEELRKSIAELMFLPDAIEHLPINDDAESKLFETRVVAEAIGSTPKHVRWFAHTRQLESETLNNEKARKLFFTACAVAKFLWSRRISLGSEVLKTAIPANPRGIGGVGWTKKNVARQLEISQRAVDGYLANGVLRRSAVSGARMTLITTESVEDLLTRLLDQEDREYTVALKHLDRARRNRFRK
jgi:hypothetical protein